MKVQYFIFVLWMVVTVPMIASARINETQEGIVKRYGSPTKEEKLGSGEKALYFDFNGYKILVVISAGKSRWETYFKKDGSDFTEDEKRSFLQKNANGNAWLLAEDVPGVTHHLSDGSLYASCTSKSIEFMEPMFRLALATKMHELLKDFQSSDGKKDSAGGF